MEEKEATSQSSTRSGINVIEFDGNTVLCRVCGDRASGFHYGVHACEGCKGFFRRSIQQKIQYRPCVKNQHCLITRVNRNRCQYCRLKKCIAIGMSRDAVRFGRVPKREKAKILEQMQKVNLQSYDGGSGGVEVADEAELMRRIIEAYDQTCQFTSRKAAIFKDEARRKGNYVSCPSKMACPLNPSPDAEYSTLDRWSLYSNGFMPAIHNVVTFAKLIPGFTSLNQDDQIMLLKSGTFEMLLLQLSCLFDSNTMFFTNKNIFMRKPHSPTTGAGYLLGSVFDFSERLTALNLMDSEMALFSAFILFSPDRPGLQNSCAIERLQSVIMELLKKELATNHNNHADLYENLLTKIPEMRLLNTVHSEKLLGLSVPSSLAHRTTPVPVEEPCLFWTNQNRGLLFPRTSPYFNNNNNNNNNSPALNPHEWSHEPQATPASTLSDGVERRRRKFEETSGDLQEQTTKFSIKDLSVNCHRVSPYSPPELVLSTPLGTFHRMPLTSWFTDHQSSLDRSNSRTSNFESALLMERGSSSSSSSSSSSNVNQLHPKKKAARVWACDSHIHSVEVAEPNHPRADVSPRNGEECDSTDWSKVDRSSTNTRAEEATNSSSTDVSNNKRKLFSDFNINSRFLSSAKSSHSAKLSPVERVQSSASPFSGWNFPKYAKNLVPFPIALWPNGSVSNAPLYLPPSFSASDPHLGGFKTPLTLLDHLMKRDDKHPLPSRHPPSRIAKDDSTKPNSIL